VDIPVQLVMKMYVNPIHARTKADVPLTTVMMGLNADV